MGKSVATVALGEDYQFRYFWLHACRLFMPARLVQRVDFEGGGVKSFDDVVVYYNGEKRDEETGRPLTADHHQVKYHITGAGVLTWDNLMDPRFINAERFSFLQKLRDAQRRFAPGGWERRFFLYSPWRVDEQLGAVWDQHSGRIDWDRLAEGGPGSKNGRLRATVRAHLGLDSDEELRLVLAPLRIEYGPTLSALGDRLTDKLLIAGLKPLAEDHLWQAYDDLGRKLLEQGRNSFDRAEIEEVCRAQGLWVRPPLLDGEAVRLGIRSFRRWAEHMDDETNSLLCLLPHYRGRQIRSPGLWAEEVAPRVEAFWQGSVKPGGYYRLQLCAHASIAFAAGYFLDPKCGAEVDLIQRTIGREEVWRPRPDAYASADCWRVTEQVLSESGADVAVAISLAHDIERDVRAYVQANLPAVGRLLHFHLPQGTGPQVVAGADMAATLATNLARELRTRRTPGERRARLHLFAAGPNGLLFFFGRQARGLGRCVLYEYDFEGRGSCTYEPAITLPAEAAC
ncbi:MAG: SAVED domain-containing protein [Chloroflexota bacterium]